MRSRRRLQVDTFPFLAVLLAAMGSLILVLLVMDLRAKRVAKYRVASQTAQRDEAARAALELRKAASIAAEDARRKEWETKRDALRQEVEVQRADFVREIGKSERDRQGLRDRDEAERRKQAELQQQADRERVTIKNLQSSQQQQAVAVAEAEKASAQSRESLTRMGKDLSQLEETAKNLKQARSNDARTFSVVPYKGKQGSDRQPLYVECATSSVIFHPDRVVQEVPLKPAEVREELARRIEAQKPRLSSAHREQPPYLLLLVRPDGIDSYYQLQGALKGVGVEFGYEFLESDWILDFPAEPPATPLTTPPSPLVRGPGSGPGSGGPNPLRLDGSGFAELPAGSPRPNTGGTPPSDGLEKGQPGGASLPNVWTTPKTGTQLPPGNPEPSRRPAQITPPRDWIVYVECKAEGATIHPARREVPMAALETALEGNPLRSMVSAMLQRQPEPPPGKVPPRLRVRFVIHPDGVRAFHAAYPSLAGLALDMDRVTLQPGDEVRSHLGY